MSTTSTRPKWHLAPPPPPTPKILHFPLSRRTRRKHHRSKNLLPPNRHYYLPHTGNAQNLFDQENIKPQTVFLNSYSRKLVVERRERVEEEREEYFSEYDGGVGPKGFAEEKWRFQAEILRAECNFLRMERELALKKLERNRVKMERTLRSAVQTLVSGRKKIFEGKNVNAVLEKEIEDLSEKLQELHKSSRIRDNEARSCSNFDKKACLLQRRLEKLRELSESSSSSNSKIENRSTEVDKVEEESTSVVSSDSISKRIECPNFSSFPTRQLYQEPMLLHDDNRCSGHCKAIIHRILEQVRAETDQWSQMQEMLEKVRAEMEELQTSRDFWENRAHSSDYEIESLKHAVEEWKEKALGYEVKANEVQQKLEQNLRQQKEGKKCVSDSSGKQHFDENLCKFEDNKELKTRANDLPMMSLGKQLAKEKKMLIYCLKEKQRANEKRFPLRDIRNSSVKERRAVLSFHGPEKLHEKRGV